MVDDNMETVKIDKLITLEDYEEAESTAIYSQLRPYLKQGISESRYGGMFYISHLAYGKGNYRYTFTLQPVLYGMIREYTLIFLQLGSISGNAHIRIKLNPNKLGITYLQQFKNVFSDIYIPLYTEDTIISGIDYAVDYPVNMNLHSYYVKHKMNYEVWKKHRTQETLYFGGKYDSNVCIYNAKLNINRKNRKGDDPRTISTELTRIESRLRKKHIRPVELFTLPNPFINIEVFTYLHDGVELSGLDYNTYSTMVALNAGANLSDLLYGAVQPTPAIKKKVLSTFRDRAPATWWKPVELWENRHNTSADILNLYRLFDLHTSHPDDYSFIEHQRLRCRAARTFIDPY